MYSVSQAYLDAMKSEEQEHILYGTIGSYSFDRSNILRGSFSITNQCSDNTEVKIGQVYIGELKATFVNVSVPRSSWRGLEITVYFGLKVAGGTFEEVPLGVYTVQEANWTASGIEVTAYDHMAKFDKMYKNLTTVGHAYPLINLACYYAGVTFGMTEAEVEALPNGDIDITAYPQNDMETWRDSVAWIAQMLGCFATMDRQGQLVLRQYGGEPVDTIDSSHRFTGASFSDYETKYTALTITEMATGEVKSYKLDTDDGLTYDLGSNPYLQYGTDTQKDERRNAILTAISAIDYVPFKVTAIGNPAYDLGDVLVFSEGLADGTKESCITKYVFTYNDSYEMQGVGKDPALATAKSKIDKALSGVLSEVSAGDYTVYAYTNADAINAGEDEWVDIANYKFATKNPKSCLQEWTEVKMTVTPTGTDPVTVYFKYLLDGQEESYQPQEAFSEAGVHTYNLLYYIEGIEATTEYRWRVLMKVVNGSATIAVEDVHSTIAGQGLAGTVGDSSTEILIQESFYKKRMAGNLLLASFTDSVIVDTPNPAQPAIGDAFDSIALNTRRVVVNYFEETVNTETV